MLAAGKRRQPRSPAPTVTARSCRPPIVRCRVPGAAARPADRTVRRHALSRARRSTTCGRVNTATSHLQVWYSCETSSRPAGDRERRGPLRDCSGSSCACTSPGLASSWPGERDAGVPPAFAVGLARSVAFLVVANRRRGARRRALYRLRRNVGDVVEADATSVKAAARSRDRPGAVRGARCQQRSRGLSAPPATGRRCRLLLSTNLTVPPDVPTCARLRQRKQTTEPGPRPR